MAAFHIFATQILEQIRRLDAVCLVKVHKERRKIGEGLPEIGSFHLKLIDQHIFNINPLAAGCAGCQFKFGGDSLASDTRLSYFGLGRC